MSEWEEQPSDHWYNDAWKAISPTIQSAMSAGGLEEALPAAVRAAIRYCQERNGPDDPRENLHILNIFTASGRLVKRPGGA